MGDYDDDLLAARLANAELALGSRDRHPANLVRTPAASRQLILEYVDEKAWQAEVVALAERLGWWAYHPFDSRRSKQGYPDLTLLRDRVVFAELKTERGRLTDSQYDVRRRLIAAGAEIHLWRPSDWDLVVATLR